VSQFTCQPLTNGVGVELRIGGENESDASDDRPGSRCGENVLAWFSELVACEIQEPLRCYTRFVAVTDVEAELHE